MIAAAHRASLASTFLHPWRSSSWRTVTLAMLPGFLTEGLLELALLYDMAGQGLFASTLFNTLYLLASSLIGMPVTFWLLSKPHGRAIVAVCQLAGGALFLLAPHSASACIVAYGLVAGPFWAAINQGSAAALSEKNHGNEMALFTYIQATCVALGRVAGGYLLAANDQQSIFLIGCGGLFLSTLFLAAPQPKRNRVAEAWKMIGWRKPTSRLTATVAALFTTTGNGLPTWMRAVGISPLSTGLLLGMQSILGLILTPLAGHLIQKGGLRAGKTGGIFMILGWALLLFAPDNIWLFLPALSLITVGKGFIDPLESNRWLRRHTATAVLAREGALSVGRLVSLPVVIPVALLTPALFPALSLAMTGLFVWGNKERARKA